jgi:integrase
MKRRGRRGNGEGTIVKRADGRFMAVASLGWEDGRRIRKCVYGKTRHEVAKQLNKHIDDHNSGRPVPTSGQTVARFLTSWLESTKHSVAPRTYEKYESVVRLHLIPGLGKHRLERLQVDHVQALLNRKLEGGLSRGSVRHMKITLSIALNHAMGTRAIGWNAAKVAKAPKKDERQVEALSPDEVARIRKAAVEGRLEALLELEFGLGLRRGEVLALTWNDISLDADPPVLHVRRSLQRAEGKLQLMPTKTKGSMRKIDDLPVAVVNALRKRRAQQAQQRLTAGAEWKDTNLIFTTETGGALEPRNVLRSYHALLARAGVDRKSIHMLRHTVASMLLSDGVSVLEVSHLLGHKDATTTLKTYAHFMPDAGRAAKKMDVILARL